MQTDTLANKIRATRQARGLTQDQLGRLCDVNHSQISRYESGLAVPPLVLVRIARALGMGVTLFDVKGPIVTGETGDY